MKTTTITRIHPEGSTLADAQGRTVTVGDKVEGGCALVLSTPDGSGGSVSMSARIEHTIATKRLVVAEPPPEPAAVETPRAPVRLTYPPALKVDV